MARRLLHGGFIVSIVTIASTLFISASIRSCCIPWLAILFSAITPAAVRVSELFEALPAAFGSALLSPLLCISLADTRRAFSAATSNIGFPLFNFGRPPGLASHVAWVHAHHALVRRPQSIPVRRRCSPSSSGLKFQFSVPALFQNALMAAGLQKIGDMAGHFRARSSTLASNLYFILPLGRDGGILGHRDCLLVLLDRGFHSDSRLARYIYHRDAPAGSDYRACPRRPADLRS